MWHKITIAGNLGKDPEMKYMNDGTAVTNFSVAVSDGYGEKKTTIWFRVSIWGKRAETANQYLQKGSKILVEGRLKIDPATSLPRLFTKQDGTTSVSLEIIADNFVFLSSKSDMDETGTPSATNAGSGQSWPAGAASTSHDDEDIPF